ncbi:MULTISPECIES: acetate uptake transporter [Streptacidiphilus]|uniref:Acetate uptake transporter n=2 Tax=Streptacidiphilus TaxID=228398 RepID=A0ABV6UNJ8_9ACTN|nr:GPR1/FUN34/YaaH family transporter [Streptacidiphilus jeojiense]
MTATSVSPAGPSPASAAPPRIGHAIAVGAAGFAWCSLALGLSTTGAMNAAGSSVILTGTFFYGGIVQMVAGFFALAAGTTFVAAFLTAYGAFWLGYTAIEFYVAPHIAAEVVAAGAGTGATPQALAGQAHHAVVQALGVFLLAWLVVTVVFTIASLGTNAVTLTAFCLLDLTIVLLAIAYLGATSSGVPVDSALHAAGWAEIVLAAVAFYVVLAELANDTLRRTVFPLFPLTRFSGPAAAAPALGA